MLVISLILLEFLNIVNGVPPIYVSNGSHIVSYSKEDADTHAVLGQKDFRIIGLAVDIAKDRLFWSDISNENKGIYTSDLRGKNITRIVHDVGEVNGLTVDWVSSHIYWTDLERKTVEVSNYDGSARRVIVSRDLKSPRAIVAAPLFGFIYWADQRANRIERAWLDGSHRRTVVKSASYWPNQLAISIQLKQFYWVDSWEHAVFSCNLNGKKCKSQVKFEQVTKGAPGFGLIVFGNTAVVSTWFDTAIYSMLLGSKQLIWQREIKNIGTRELFSLTSLNPFTQPMTYHPCMDDDNGGCSHLCLPTHKTKFQCSCPTYGGLALSTDNATCLVPEQILLMSFEDTGDIGFVATDPGWSREIHLISASKSPGSITYDRKDRMIYWSDTTEGTVYRSRIEGTEKSVFLNRTDGIGRVDDLSFNTETGTLYFTNVVLMDNVSSGSSHSVHTVEMVNVHTADRRVIFKSKDKTIRLLVDEEERYVYIAVAGHLNRIIRTELDGSNVTMLHVNVSDPVGLSLSGEMLTIADRRYKSGVAETAFIRYNVLDETVVNEETKNITTYAIATRRKETYIADAVHSNILLVNGSHNEKLIDFRMVSAVRISSTSRDVKDYTEGCLKFGCSHSCVPLSNSSVDEYRCLCPAKNSLILDWDTKTCKRPDSFLIYADVNNIQMLALDKGLTKEPITLYFGDANADIASVVYDEELDRIYWTDRNSKSIYLSHLHEIEPMLVYRQEDPINELVLDTRRQRLYWTSQFESGLGYYITTISMKKGLSSKMTLFTYHRAMKSLAQQNSRWLYWIEEETAYDRAGIGSCKAKPPVRYDNVIQDGLMSPRAIFVDDDKLYLAESDGNIFVKNLEGETLEIIRTTSKDVSSMLVQDNFLIMSDVKDNVIRSLDMKSRETQVLVANLNRPTGLGLHYDIKSKGFCEQSGCSDICVSLLRDNYVCRCSDGKILQADEKTCLSERTIINVNASAASVIKDVSFVDYTTVKLSASVRAELKTDLLSTTVKIEDTKQNNIPTLTNITTPDDLTDATSDTPYVNELSSLPMTTQAVSSRQSTTLMVNGHSGEPKPTLSTAPEETTETIDTTVAPAQTRTDHNYTEFFYVPPLTSRERIQENIKVEPMEKPHFENCPEGETIIASVPGTDSALDIPIRPIGYDNRGNLLPIHCNYELTESGVLIHWVGSEEESRHNVTFHVTDSLRQTAECTFTVVLQDVDPPIFTYCPDTVKVWTEKHSELVNWTVPEAVDNVGLKLLKNSHTPGTLFTPGASVINYTAVDFAGNKAACLFNVYLLHDGICNLPEISHGGIVCGHGDGVTGDCRVVCEDGYVINPIRTFRRSFNCMHPDDIDDIRKVMKKQKACIKHEYPSLLRQEFSLLINGPVSQHKHRVKTDINNAISNHLVNEQVCVNEVCKFSNISMHCDQDATYVDEHVNGSCLDDKNRTEFFINFNITLSNSTGVDVDKLLYDIHLELLSLASLLQLQIEGQMFMANADSLTKTGGGWTCPIGQIHENNICISCPVGTMHNVSINACQYCTIGFYQDAPSQINCRMCEVGLTSPDGSTSSTQCHAIPSMDEMTLFIIVTACSFGVVFLCMAITLYLQFQRQRKRNQQAASSSLKKTRYNMTPNVYVAPPPILKSKLDENYTSGHKTYSIDKKKPINIYSNHEYEDVNRSVTGSLSAYQADLYNMLQGQGRDYSPGDEIPTGTLSRENTFSNPTYSPNFAVRGERGSLQRTAQAYSPGPQRKMSYDSTFSNQSPRLIRSQRTPTSDTPLITQSPLLRLKLAAYNLNHED